MDGRVTGLPRASMRARLAVKREMSSRGRLVCSSSAIIAYERRIRGVHVDEYVLHERKERFALGVDLGTMIQSNEMQKKKVRDVLTS